MKDKIKYSLFTFWVWFGHKFVGWHKITLHNSKDGKRVNGVTFGEIED